MTQLPAGWAIARVEEVVAEGGITDGPFGSNLKTAHYRDSGPRVIRLQNVGDGAFRDERAHIEQEHYERLTKHAVLPGDVLIASLGEALPRACLAPDIGPAIVKADVIRARTASGVTSSYLMWALNSPQIRERVANQIKGVGRPRFSLGGLRVLDVPIAPAAEQARIVAAIEEAFSLLDAGETALHNTRTRLKRMRDSVLTSAVAGQLVPQDPTDTPAERLLRELGIEPLDDVQDLPPVPEAWRWARLGEAAEVVGGVTKDAKRQNDPGSVEVPYLRVANVQRGYLDLTTVTTIRVPPTKAGQLQLRPGDVLFNEGGDRDKLGRGWVWEGQVADCIHQNHVYRARPAPGLEPKLVSWWGNTFGRAWFEFHGKQTTNLASINLTTLKSFPVPIPPPEEQARIVAEVERQFSFIGAVERAVDEGLARAAALRRSVLKSAFEGRLVPQDPADEPASVLLERIAAERGAAPGKVSRRRRAEVEAS